MAILVDNDHQERMNGFTTEDMIEIYEQSLEAMALNEHVSLTL